MKKEEAIQLINSRVSTDTVTKKNTHFANISNAKTNSKKVWWLSIPVKKFNQDLYLVLQGTTSLIWLEITANFFDNLNSIFSHREDKGKGGEGYIDLEIDSKQQNYLRDIRSRGTRYNFNDHIKDTFELP